MKNKTPFAIILNGTSSVGKSSIQKEILTRLKSKNIFPLKIDDYVNKLPKNLVGKSVLSTLGFQFYQPTKDEYNIKIGRLGNLVVNQLHNDASKLLRSGANIILDHVVLSKEWADVIESLQFTGAQIYKILITCESEELSKREKLRGDRLLGLAKGLKYVEENIKNYDLIIDTTKISVIEASNLILKYLSEHEKI